MKKFEKTKNDSKKISCIEKPINPIFGAVLMISYKFRENSETEKGKLKLTKLSRTNIGAASWEFWKLLKMRENLFANIFLLLCLPKSRKSTLDLENEHFFPPEKANISKSTLHQNWWNFWSTRSWANGLDQIKATVPENNPSLLNWPPNKNPYI